MSTRNSVSVVFCKATIDVVLSQMITATPEPPSWIGGHLGLFTGAINPTPETPTATFTAAAATFPGYAAATVAALSRVNLSPSASGCFLSAAFTRNSSSGDGVTVTGLYITNESDEVICSEQFTEPVEFVLNGDFLDLNVFIPWNFLQNTWQ